MKTATVVSALPLTTKEKEASQIEIRRIFPNSEAVNFVVDSAIIGGLIFKTDEKILDLSAKEQLQQIEQKLNA